VNAPSNRVDDVMTWYDTIAPSYDELYGAEQLRKYDHIFAVIQAPRILPHQENLVVIDVGCGTSLIVEELKKALAMRKYYYVGIDISLNILKIAKRRIEELDIIADLVAGDASNLPFREDIADIVFSISVFRCEDPVDNLIRESLRLCRPLGVVALTIVCGEGVDEIKCQEYPNSLYEGVIKSGRELIRVIKCEQLKDSDLREKP